MSSESITNELFSLTRDAREHLTYLHELGIEGINKEVGPSASVVVATEQATVSKPSFVALVPEGVPEASSTLFGEIRPAPARLVPSSETVEDIHADIGNCVRCSLYERRTHIVHTEGKRSARLMFIGEAPGADEDAQARPFVGKAGQLLTKIIESIGFKREEVLIGNVN